METPSPSPQCDHHNQNADHSVLTAPFIKKLEPPSSQPPILKPKPTSNPLLLSFVEARSILGLTIPMIATGLLLYSRSMISMLFLGRLGSLPLAGGALAIGFANITGYSVLSGLAIGMEPICGQAFGAKKNSLVGLALKRTIILLLLAAIPIAVLWANMRRILLAVGQNYDIADAAHAYILFSLPDLVLQSLLNPIRIYLRTQSITLPLSYAAAASLAAHLPINYLLVSKLHLGIRGVAIAGIWTNINLLILLVGYIYFSGVYRSTGGFSIDSDCFKGFKPLLALAVPSCVSVCLEWWWYEIMILLCGVLLNPQATVASMGILIQTTSLIYIFPSSLSFGVSTRVGNELGANRPDKARRSAMVGMSCSLFLGVGAFAFAVSVRNLWAGMFTTDAGIASLTASVLPILGACELGNCPQTTGCGVLRGSARPKAGARINLGSFYVVGMPVAVVLAFWVGLDFSGLWIGLMAAQATCVVMMVVVIGRTDWEMQAERAQRLTGGGIIDDGEVEEEKKVEDGGDETSSLVLSVKIEQPTALT